MSTYARPIVATLAVLLMVIAITASTPKPAAAQSPTPTTPPTNTGSPGGFPLAIPPQNTGQNPSGGTGIDGLLGGCGQNSPTGDTQNCDDPVVIVHGISTSGVDCASYFRGLLVDLQSFGYPRNKLTTVAYNADDQNCDVNVADFPHTSYNNHSDGGGDRSNHVWVGGPNCDPSQDFYIGSNPSHCWDHSRRTPISHIAYHFAHYLDEAYSGNVDVVAHSMGGLITAAAHTGHAFEQGLPPGVRAFPVDPPPYDQVVTSGTPFMGAGLVSTGNAILSFIPSFVPLLGSLEICEMRYGPTPNQCTEMLPGSPFLQQLHAFWGDAPGEWTVIGSDVELFGVRTQTDLTVTFQSATSFPTNQKFVYFQSDPDRDVVHAGGALAALPSTVYYYDYQEKNPPFVCNAPPFPWFFCQDAGGFATHFRMCDPIGCQPPTALPGTLDPWFFSPNLQPRHNRLVFWGISVEGL